LEDFGFWISDFGKIQLSRYPASCIRFYKMPVHYGRFEMPKTLVKDENGATETYARFVAEPFEAGYGHTVGNSLRRVLLSSLEGAAITAVKITGAQHEFATLPGVVEDVTDIVLNLKRIKFKAAEHEPRKLSLTVNKEGEVTAEDIQLVQGYEVLNPDQLICTMDKKHKFDAELEVRVGRGFATGDENKRPDQPIGLIPIDSIFSPVTRVKYAVENTRVGQRTDYDKLILEVWTDGRLTPDDALLQASAILRHHLDVFVNFNEDVIEFDETPAGVSEENMKLKKLLNMSVNEIELSVRAANCLNNANITTVGQLAQKTETEMLKYRNFGKKSLNEIKDKLQQLQLGLGMKFDPGLVDTPIATDSAGVNGSAEEEKK
jgi:DNA-directed RNA polymerase subunit alpha